MEEVASAAGARYNCGTHKWLVHDKSMYRLCTSPYRSTRLSRHLLLVLCSASGLQRQLFTAASAGVCQIPDTTHSNRPATEPRTQIQSVRDQIPHIQTVPLLSPEHRSSLSETRYHTFKPSRYWAQNTDPVCQRPDTTHSNRPATEPRTQIQSVRYQIPHIQTVPLLSPEHRSSLSETRYHTFKPSRYWAQNTDPVCQRPDPTHSNRPATEPRTQIQSVRDQIPHIQTVPLLSPEHRSSLSDTRYHTFKPSRYWAQNTDPVCQIPDTTHSNRPATEPRTQIQSVRDQIPHIQTVPLLSPEHRSSLSDTRYHTFKPSRYWAQNTDPVCQIPDPTHSNRPATEPRTQIQSVRDQIPHIQTVPLLSPEHRSSLSETRYHTFKPSRYWAQNTDPVCQIPDTTHSNRPATEPRTQIQSVRYQIPHIQTVPLLSPEHRSSLSETRYHTFKPSRYWAQNTDPVCQIPDTTHSNRPATEPRTQIQSVRYQIPHIQTAPLLSPEHRSSLSDTRYHTFKPSRYWAQNTDPVCQRPDTTHSNRPATEPRTQIRFQPFSHVSETCL